METWQVIVLVVIVAAAAAIVTRWLTLPAWGLTSSSLIGRVVGYSLWSWNANQQAWTFQGTIPEQSGQFGYVAPPNPPFNNSIPDGYTVKVIYHPPLAGRAVVTKT